MKPVHWIISGMYIGVMGLGAGCSDSDGGADGDGDTDTDVDTESGIAPAMTDCDGGKLDLATNLCWQDLPSGYEMNWYEAAGVYDDTSNPDTLDYCGDLDHGGHSDWRLPNIDELKSLLRGCQDGTATGYLRSSLCEMTPAGCAETDTCSGISNCLGCSYLSGPGADGCYWNSTLTGTCWPYWSSSSYTYYEVYAWCVSFRYGDVFFNYKSNSSHARCVRGGP